MRRIFSVLAVILMTGLGLFGGRAYAEAKPAKIWHIYELKQLVNDAVKNTQGQYLGRLEDFVIDSSGRVVFAVVTKPGILGIRGEPVAVPFTAFSLADNKDEMVLNMSREKFASAPRYDAKADLENPAWAAETYRYFGVQPYWAE